METVFVGIVGLCIGVLMAHCWVPRVQIVPWVCSTIVTASVAVVIVRSDVDSVDFGSVFTLGVIVGGCLYAAELWRRLGLREKYSYWELIWMSVFRPGYLRASYKQSQESSG